jgi:hypothetical protein
LAEKSEELNYKLDVTEIDPDRCKEISLFSRGFRLFWGASSFLITGYWFMFLQEKSCRGLKVTSHTIIPEATNEWNCISTSPKAFMALTVTTLPLLISLPPRVETIYEELGFCGRIISLLILKIIL